MTSDFFQTVRYGLHALLAIAVLCVTQTYAADKDADKPRIYQVDVIVFRNLNPNASSETWPLATAVQQQDPTAPDNLELLLSQVEPAINTDSLASDLSAPDSLVPDQNPDNSAFRIFYELNDTRRLNGEYKRLTSSTNYQPILYATWRQEVADKVTAEAFDVALTGVPGNVLDGQFRLYRERYMHLVVDLQLPAESSRFANTQPLVYTMSQSRRLRDTDIQYFDHPKFGVISLVTEIK
jgi:hypothetical protein